AIGVSLAELAALCMTGKKLSELGFTHEVKLPYTAVKEAVFPFVKFPGVDITLTPEMKSTGEVMSIDRDGNIAYLKSQIAAGGGLPKSGNVAISVKDEDKADIVPLAEKLVGLGFTIFATLGTSTYLYDAGIKTRALFRISKGRPNMLDLIRERAVQWIINTSEPGAEAMTDEVKMRSKAIAAGIPVTTTVAGAAAALEGLRDQLEFGRFEVCSLQEYHRHLVRK
ncbi:MAG: carbamoyl phosphate synthase large subunit, partial [Lentisphaeria bacterium]|nr:carbamoyl phosphate synthase large subunit [Lentisphaeria bacterium]